MAGGGCERPPRPRRGRRSRTTPRDLTTPPAVARVEDAIYEWNNEIHSCGAGRRGRRGGWAGDLLQPPAVTPSASPTPASSIVVSTPTPTQGAVQPTTPSPTLDPSTTPGAANAPWIIFHRRIPAQEGGPRSHSEMWAIRADGTGAHKLAEPQPGISDVAWSKDGSACSGSTTTRSTSPTWAKT